MSRSRSLLGLIEDRIAAGQVSLPPCNSVIGKLQELTADPNFDIEKAVEVITRDQSLTAEILRLANSAFYGGLTPVTRVRDAAVRLGAAEVVRLAAVLAEKGQYQVRSPQLVEFMDPLWQHAVAVAMGSGWLARKLGYPDLVNEAFVGGLLHDVGGLVLVRVLDDLDQAGELDFPFSATLVREIIESAHAAHGLALARHWDLPEVYCEVIGGHHQESLADRGVLINIVALADKAAAQLGIGLENDPSIVLSATEEAFTLGARDILLAQLSVMLEDTAVFA